MNRNRQRLNINNNDIALRGSIGAWYGAFFAALGAIISYEILKNNRKNTQNTAELLEQIKLLNKNFTKE